MTAVASSCQAWCTSAGGSEQAMIAAMSVAAVHYMVEQQVLATQGGEEMPATELLTSILYAVG